MSQSQLIPVLPAQKNPKFKEENKVLLSLIHKMLLQSSKRRATLDLSEQSIEKRLEQGLTILECLVAVVVVSVVTASMTPPILVAVATRLQNQRAEQAFQLAQAEIDRVRLMLERGDYSTADLPPVSATSVRATSAPEGYVTAPTPITVTKGLAVDVDKDNINDFVVQVFRSAGEKISTDDTRPITFEMGVRVYSSRAFQGASKPTLQTDPAPLTFTNGEGYQRTRPLSVIYTRLTQSDIKESFEGYQKSLK